MAADNNAFLPFYPDVHKRPSAGHEVVGSVRNALMDSKHMTPQRAYNSIIKRIGTDFYLFVLFYY